MHARRMQLMRALGWSLFFVDAKTGYAWAPIWNRSSGPVPTNIDGAVTWSALAIAHTTRNADLLFLTPAYGFALEMFGDV